MSSTGSLATSQTFVVQPKAAILLVRTTKFSSLRPLFGAFSFHDLIMVVVYMILFFSIRGLIGPSRQFGRGSIYYPQLYAIIVGALLPFPFWIMQRRRPDSWAKFVSTPVVLLGVSFIPPATGINYSAWFAVGFVFQFIIRKRNFAWWSKYNYVTGAALDCGLFFSRYSLW